jgi:hypothetical protein
MTAAEITEATRDLARMDAEREAMKASLTGQLQALIEASDPWATAWMGGTRAYQIAGRYVQAQENLGEVLESSLGHNKKISFTDVAAYLLTRAGEGDTVAQELLSRMTEAWVEANVDYAVAREVNRG